MKKTFLFLITIFISLSLNLAAENRIAVVEGRYDNIKLVLGTYHIPYDTIKFKDLANKEIYSRYSSIFFPSGISAPQETNIDVSIQGKNIQSVALSKDFFELDQEQFKENMREFTENGGASYFSGYAFKYLARIYDSFEFFYDFPYMGIPGRIEAAVKNDLARFSLRKKSALYMGYTGWITLKNVKDAEVLSEARFSTPRGEKFGPISVLLKKGDGEILYTSYYSTVYSEFKRFNIYRVAGFPLAKKLSETAGGLFQNVTGRISDAFLKGENSRTYFFNLGEGSNRIYLSSEGSSFMFEVYDSDMSMIASVENSSLSQTFDIDSQEKDYCFVKIYPADSSRFHIFSILSAEGYPLSFEFINIKNIAIMAVSLIFLTALVKVSVSRLN